MDRDRDRDWWHARRNWRCRNAGHGDCYIVGGHGSRRARAGAVHCRLVQANEPNRPHKQTLVASNRLHQRLPEARRPRTQSLKLTGSANPLRTPDRQHTPSRSDFRTGVRHDPDRRGPPHVADALLGARDQIFGAAIAGGNYAPEGAVRATRTAVRRPSTSTLTAIC